ncbi:hypothetical protein ACH4OW_12375 [Streptomyces sp. NPDC017056]
MAWFGAHWLGPVGAVLIVPGLAAAEMITTERLRLRPLTEAATD